MLTARFASVVGVVFVVSNLSMAEPTAIVNSVELDDAPTSGATVDVVPLLADGLSAAKAKVVLWRAVGADENITLDDPPRQGPFDLRW